MNARKEHCNEMIRVDEVVPYSEFSSERNAIELALRKKTCDFEMKEEWILNKGST